MPPMSKFFLFAAIRRDSRAGLSVRALARKYQISRRTVRFGAEFGVAGTAQADAAAALEAGPVQAGHRRHPARGSGRTPQAAAHREKASVAIASNEAFSAWTRTFTDRRLCVAIVDRLTFGGNIIETGTDSCRLAKTRNQLGNTSQ